MFLFFICLKLELLTQFAASNDTATFPIDLCSTNILSDQLAHLEFHPLEVMSRYRYPQLESGENYSYLFNLRPNISQY